MAKIKGICKNIDGCDLAAGKVIQEVDSYDFKCSECGKDLYPLEDKKKKKKAGIPVVAIIAIVVALLAIIGGIIAFSGGDSEEPQSPGAVVDSATVKDSVVAEPVVAKDTVVVTDTVIQRDTVVQRDTVKVAVPVKVKQATPAKSSGTLRLSYGTYTGDSKNGQPHGMGRLAFNTSHQIDSRDPKARVAEAGDYVIGEFVEGHLVQGTWYGSDNVVKGSVLIGR